MEGTAQVDLRAVQTLTAYVSELARGLTEQPDQVTSAPADHIETTVEIVITAPTGQLGRVLGHAGQNIMAIRRLAQARGKLLGLQRVRVTVKEP